MSESNGLPPWWHRTASAYLSGEAHFVILHGIGVTDLTQDQCSFGEYLERCLAFYLLADPVPTEDVPDPQAVGGAVWYARHSGFTFGQGPNEAKWKQAFSLTVAETMPPSATLPGQQVPSAAVRAETLNLQAYGPPGSALPVLDRVMRQHERRFVVVVEFPEALVPESQWASMSGEDRTALSTLLSWSAPEFCDKGHLVLLIARNLNDLHSSLRAASAHILTVEVPYPDLRERTDLITRLEQRYTHLTGQASMDLDAAEAGRLTAGMGRLHIEDGFLAARQAGVPVDRERLAEHKRQVVKAEFGDVLEPWDPTAGFESIGGCEHVKQFFRRQLIEPIRRGDLRRVPRGVLLIGPPGVGKSRMASAVACEAGMNAVKFDPSKVFDKWVGSTERNLSRALRALTIFEPALVFIDEIDQMGLNRGGEGNSGTSDRVFGMMLEFMAREENRGRVCFLAASNRPDLLDAALKRPGRFDKKIVFGPPDPVERNVILAMHLCQQIPGLSLDFDTVKPWVENLEWWTGAELEALAIKVAEIYSDDDPFEPTFASVHPAVTEALRLFRPSTGSIQEQTMLALAEVSDLELLPPQYRSLALNAPSSSDPSPATTGAAAPRKRRNL